MDWTGTSLDMDCGDVGRRANWCDFYGPVLTQHFSTQIMEDGNPTPTDHDG